MEKHSRSDQVLMKNTVKRGGCSPNEGARHGQKGGTQLLENKINSVVTGGVLYVVTMNWTAIPKCFFSF